MSKKEAWLNSMKKRAKEREGRPAAVGTVPLEANGRQEHRMQEQHPDVLLAIEMGILLAFRDDQTIDDQIAASAVANSIRRLKSDDPRVRRVQERIFSKLSICSCRPSEELFCEGLQVVYSSIKRHSSCRSGDMGYIGFIINFIPVDEWEALPSEVAR